MSEIAAIAELCQVEGDDDLHEFGGGHGNKGNDFARFWLMVQPLRIKVLGGLRIGGQARCAHLPFRFLSQFFNGVPKQGNLVLMA
jgi:hypothetical protein